MKKLHLQEKTQFIKLFKQENIDNFKDRFRVLEVFLQNESHVSADDLSKLLKENGYSLSKDFVIDTLNLMCRFGFAQENRFDNGKILYEHRHLGLHHDHMICTKCRRIVEFHNKKLETLQMKIASSNGFHLLQHRMEMYGICSSCLKERSLHFPLESARRGERLKVHDLIGGKRFRMRMMSMGIRPGDAVQVILNEGKGQMIIALDLKRLVLCRRMARKILVESDVESEKE